MADLAYGGDAVEETGEHEGPHEQQTEDQVPDRGLQAAHVAGGTQHRVTATHTQHVGHLLCLAIKIICFVQKCSGTLHVSHIYD